MKERGVLERENGYSTWARTEEDRRDPQSCILENLQISWELTVAFISIIWEKII